MNSLSHAESINTTFPGLNEFPVRHLDICCDYQYLVITCMDHLQHVLKLPEKSEESATQCFKRLFCPPQKSRTFEIIVKKVIQHNN